jgi:hypothetical protein
MVAGAVYFCIQHAHICMVLTYAAKPTANSVLVHAYNVLSAVCCCHKADTQHTSSRVIWMHCEPATPEVNALLARLWLSLVYGAEPVLADQYSGAHKK